MSIHIDYETQQELPFDYRSLVKRVINQALKEEKCPFETEVSVLFTNNQEIKRLNKEFRKIDKETDVLSFPMADYEGPADFQPLLEHYHEYFNPETKELVLGDIIISVEKAMEQAAAYGHSLEREIGFLTAHSMLHLFGYDHKEEKECKNMEEKQEKILASLGILR